MYVYAAVFLAALAVGFGGGWKTRSWKADSDDRARIEAQAEADRLSRARVNTAASAHEDSKAAARMRERIVVKEVDRVVEKPVYRNECLDDDGLRILTSDIDARAGSKPTSAVPAASTPSR
jgi:hypothetical protein